MATIQILDRDCEAADCKGRATMEILKSSGEKVGAFCSRHAHSKLIEVTKQEQPVGRKAAK